MIGVTAHIPILMLITLNVLEPVASSPLPVIVPTTLGPTRPIVGNTINPRVPYAPQFSLPMVVRDYPYGMETLMMADLQINASTYVDNNMIIFSPHSPQVASGSTLSNPSRMTQPQTRLSYVPQTTPSLNLTFLNSVRK